MVFHRSPWTNYHYYHRHLDHDDNHDDNYCDDNRWLNQKQNWTMAMVVEHLRQGVRLLEAVLHHYDNSPDDGNLSYLVLVHECHDDLGDHDPLNVVLVPIGQSANDHGHDTHRLVHRNSDNHLLGLDYIHHDRESLQKTTRYVKTRLVCK